MKRFIFTTIVMIICAVSSIQGQYNPNTQVNMNTTPGWVNEPIISEKYSYYKGEAIDQNLERAQLKARVDATRKYVMATQQGSSEPMLDYVKVTAQAESLATSAAIVFNAAKIQNFAFVADYTESVPQFGQVAYHYYVLFRTPKKQPSVLENFGKGIVYRTDAVLHSVVYPGWGQLRQGRTGTAAFYMTTTTIAGLTAGTCYVLEKNNFKNQDWKTYRRGATYVTLGLYSLNIVDSFLFGRKHKEDKIQFYGNVVKVNF